jgi:heme-degrading monooxygenase HmoA
MFARNVSVHLKPNTLNDFKQTFEKEVVPMLRKQAGFRDEITLAGDNDAYVTAISLWESKEQAEAYNSSTYPTVLKTLDKFLDGPPKVRVSSVISSTSHKLTAAAVVAA